MLFPGLVFIAESFGPHAGVLNVLVVLQLVSALALMSAGLNHVNAVDQSEEVRKTPGAAVPLLIQRWIYFLFATYAGLSGLFCSGLLTLD